MRRFAALWRALDETPRSAADEALLAAYFREAPPEDAAWGLRFLLGPRPKRAMAPPKLREWAAAEAGIPRWLLDASHEVVGDLAETVSHMLDAREEPREWPLHRLVAERLAPLAGAGDAEKRELLRLAWRELPGEQRVVWNKLVSGTLRVGVRKGVVARALAAAGRDPAELAQRLSVDGSRVFDFAAGLEVEPEVVERAAAVDEEPPAESRTVEAVLLYAERGQEGRGTHYTHLTLALWSGDDQLVPVAKVDCALPHAEILELDRWVRRHIAERFGPVRQVHPELVFELTFEGVQPSGRHKSGIVLRSPRVARWLRDRTAAQAATLASLHALLD